MDNVQWSMSNYTLLIINYQLPQEMFYLILLKDAQHRLTIGGVVDILAGEQTIHQVFHFHIAQHLTVWDGSLTGKGQSQSTVDFIHRSYSLSMALVTMSCTKRTGFNPSRPAGTQFTA